MSWLLLTYSEQLALNQAFAAIPTGTADELGANSAPILTCSAGYEDLADSSGRFLASEANALPRDGVQPARPWLGVPAVAQQRQVLICPQWGRLGTRPALRAMPRHRANEI